MFKNFFWDFQWNFTIFSFLIVYRRFSSVLSSSSHQHHTHQHFINTSDPLLSHPNMTISLIFACGWGNLSSNISSLPRKKKKSEHNEEYSTHWLILISRMISMLIVDRCNFSASIASVFFKIQRIHLRNFPNPSLKCLH